MPRVESFKLDAAGESSECGASRGWLSALTTELALASSRDARATFSQIFLCTAKREARQVEPSFCGLCFDVLPFIELLTAHGSRIGKNKPWGMHTDPALKPKP